MRRLSNPTGVEERLRHAREVAGMQDEIGRLSEMQAAGQTRLQEAARLMEKQRARVMELEE